ncbi:MAG: GxxExxY protein, partial [Candidatus Vogelbacteria bacterium]|nr:GxxExxY protein [Candidatus Vogelbacteria bacterium]
MELKDSIERIFRLNPLQKTALKKLKIETLADLLLCLPNRHEAGGNRQKISELKAGEEVVIYGKIISAKTKKSFRSKVPMGEAIVEDETGRIKIVWFHQPYLAKKIAEGQFAEFRGKVSQKRKPAPADGEASPSAGEPARINQAGELYITNPEVRDTLGWQAQKESLFYEGDTGNNLENFLIPVYPETRGISSGWFYYHIKKLIGNNLHDKIVDPIPKEILKKYNLPSLKTALVWIHLPKKIEDSISARKRFAFEEVFFIQLARLRDKKIYQSNPSFKTKVSRKDLKEFLDRFPFKPTEAQTKAIDIILADFAGDKPMVRLLEGDVGSGKTMVAATTTFAMVKAGLEVSYMAPTEILARQHFESFIKYFEHMNIQVGLITGKECKKFPSKIDPHDSTHISRATLLKWVANGEIPILVGTHALIQKKVKFKKLGLAIIDEQHRFGVYQRQALVRRSDADKTQKNADNNFLYRDLSYVIRNSIFTVANSLGLGHKEIIYQKALAEEFKKNKLAFDREKQIPIMYSGKKVGVYVPDFVIENKIIVELKAIPFLGTSEKKQAWNYLKGSDYRLALLVNFSPKQVEIERIIYDIARSKSASHPQESASLSASVPHLLSMTATPIPRTLALTVFGDLDLTLLDQMPAGRKPIITKIVSPDKRDEAYEHIRAELKAGRQAYVICPRIDEPDPDKEMAVQAKSAKAETIRLQDKIFPEFTVEVMHSKLKPKDKEDTMQQFTDGEIDILVSTSVIEVGVNVPNATIIIIEGAERFGLAQLHQLRGRVLRSNHQAYCYIFSETKSQKSMDRLKALVNAKNGFEL